MVVSIDTELFRVRFNYFTDNGYRVSLAIVERLPPSSKTQRFKDDWVVISKGRAQCSHDDQFSRRAGRRLALTRALSFEKRVFRGKIWRALLAQGMKP